MIKCNVTVCGAISRSAQMRTGKEGKSFLSFGVNVVIPAKSGINKTIDVSVAKDGNTLDELSAYPVGTRVEITGNLTFHKKGESLYFNLSATDIKNLDDESKEDIKGEMDFRGTFGKKIEDKTDKKGNPFCVFSAFSSEKSGDSYEYTWVRFLHFGETRKDWMQPKTGVNVKGELQVTVYNDRLDIGCRVKELSPWDKTAANSNN
jgi:hypothetical protein